MVHRSQYGALVVSMGEDEKAETKPAEGEAKDATTGTAETDEVKSKFLMFRKRAYNRFAGQAQATN